MTVDTEATPRRRRFRRWMLALLVVVVLLVAAALYLVFLGVKAKDSIESARDHASAAQRAFLDGDTAVAVEEANAAVRDADDAESRAHNPVWTVAAAVPWLGDPLSSVQKLTESVQGLTVDVLAPVSELADVLSPQGLRTADNTVNIEALAGVQPQLAEIADRAEQLRDEVAGTDGSWLGMVDSAKGELLDQTAETSRFIRGTDTAAQLLPPMLGNQGQRNYFFGFQTPAESRATGGLLGAYGVVSARNGKVDVGNLGTNAALNPPRNPIDLGEEFTKNYGYNRAYTDNRNSNISAHFPYAAQIWMSMWEQQTGTQLDGALAVDPIALSYLLNATGPITLKNGQEVNGDNVVDITLSSSYVDFSEDNNARKAYLQEIARSAVAKLTSLSGNTGAILEALGRSVQERRLMIYSADENEQKLLQSAGLAHDVPETDAPFAEVVVGNLAGNKIDYYLRRDIKYTAGTCDADTRDSVVEVTLTNTLEDLSLPPYVIGHIGNPQADIPSGTNLASVSLYGTAGATLNSMTVDDESNFFSETTERGHPLYNTQVQIPPGKSVVIKYNLTEPTAPGEPQVPIQPLVDKPAVTVDVPACKE
jgi:hypothetical protein